MTQQLEHPWVKEIFTQDELKQYAQFETDLKSNPDQKAEFEKNWNDLIAEIKNNLDKDPTSAIGIAIGEKIYELD